MEGLGVSQSDPVHQVRSPGKTVEPVISLCYRSRWCVSLVGFNQRGASSQLERKEGAEMLLFSNLTFQRKKNQLYGKSN